jgi:hypothetical protein
VRGIINSRSNRAKFQGPLAQNDVVWEETDNLLPNLKQATKVYLRTFGATTVVKAPLALAGPEYISIEIEYENQWSPRGYKRQANTQNADFTISVT